MVLLIVDTQNSVVNAGIYALDTFVKHVQTLIAEARHKQIEVIYVCHEDEDLIRGTEGYEIYEAFKPLATEKIFYKKVNSAFSECGLKEYLQSKNEKEIIICGLDTDYCIDATIKCGFEHGFHMIVPAYANSTVDNRFMTGEQSYAYYNEHMWPRRYAECISLEETFQKMNDYVASTNH